VRACVTHQPDPFRHPDFLISSVSSAHHYSSLNLVLKLALPSTPMSLKRDRNEDANLVPDDVATAVKASLNLGRVPPIFHAYCARFFVDYDSRKDSFTDDVDAAEDEEATEDEDAISPYDQKPGSREPNDRETMISPGSLDEFSKEMLKPLGLKIGGNKQVLNNRITGATASAGPPGVAAAGGICGAAGIPLDSSVSSRKKAPPDVAEAIEKQKTHAMALWETVCAGRPHVEEAYGGDEGQVSPICLTYGRRLFAECDNSPHVLSAERVTRGECKKRQKGTLVSAKNYEREFLFTDKHGTHYAKETVRDDGLGMHHVWTFDSALSDDVCDLVNESSVMVGHDVEATQVSSNLILESGLQPGDCEITNLITRNLSRGIVADCFRRSTVSSEYAIVGSPGIGKSWTLLYALQQALLYRGACVVFFQPKLGKAFVCIRKENHVFVWSAFAPSPALSILFANKDVLVLLDPLEAGEGGAKYKGGSRMLIFAASNNKAHFTSQIGKVTGDYRRILGPYTDAELTVCLPLMGCKDTRKALKRAKFVGNSPRYLMDDALYRTRLDDIDETAQTVSTASLNMERIVAWNGMDEIRPTKTIAGTLFSVSAMMDNEEDPDIIGYDGESGVDYGTLKLQVLSDHVRTRVVIRSRSSILTFWAKVGAGVRSHMGDCVESLFWEDLTKPTSRMKRWEMRGKRKPTDTADDLRLTGTIVFPKFATIEDLKGVLSMEKTVCRMNKNFAAIDFAGPGPLVYQVTVSDDHSLSISGTAKLLMNLGYLVMKGKTYVFPATPPPTLQFHWVVPYQSESKWKSRSQKSTTGKGPPGLKEVVDRCLQKYVVQYVLIMEDEVPV
jgi:hypothetical protein